MAEKKTTEAVDGATLDERVVAIESYINKDIRQRKQQKRELRRLKRTNTNPAIQQVLDTLDDTDNEEELGA